MLLLPLNLHSYTLLNVAKTSQVFYIFISFHFPKDHLVMVSVRRQHSKLSVEYKVFQNLEVY